MNKQKKYNPNGLILWEGPSPEDGKPIVIIATSICNPSVNIKTGDMIGVIIIRSDIHPILANRTGEDESICGPCPLKGIANMDKDSGQADDRVCYLSWNPILAIYNCYKEGKYEKARDLEHIAEIGATKEVRLGTYGDPAFIPKEILEALVSRQKSWTGYSHQDSFDPRYMMKSVETLEQMHDAQAKGIRTFRVGESVEDMDPDSEILCPGSKEAGRVVQCKNCLLCKGSDPEALVQIKSIFNVVHGSGKTHFDKAVA